VFVFLIVGSGVMKGEGETYMEEDGHPHGRKGCYCWYRVYTFVFAS